MVTLDRSDTKQNATSTPPKKPSPFDGLSLRIVAMMSLALLPLGLVTVLQAQRSEEAAVAAQHEKILAQTTSAVQPERERILSAFAVARTLAGTVATLRPGNAACTDVMRQAATASERTPFQFVGHVALDLVSQCNNMSRAFDFADSPQAQSLFSDPKPHVSFNESGRASGLPVVIVTQPVYLANRQFDGFISLSFEGRAPAPSTGDDPMQENLQLVTFNSDGRILTSNVPRERVETILPYGTSLQEIATGDARVFSGQTYSGQPRHFAIAPILEGRAYALGSWAPSSSMVSLVNSHVVSTSFIFAFLIWLTSLAITVFALRRQVVRPIKTLQMRMRSFADGRKMLRGNTIENAPSELREIGAAFEKMADQIVRDEAELEDQLYERELLTLEVHHRVKNNLQLMTSIVNMQIRQTSSAEVAEALRSVQARLASLAKFHQDIYEGSFLSDLEADRLLDDLARQMMAMRDDATNPIDLQLSLEKITLTPDQASPLALLTTEAFTNALKNVGSAPGDRAFIRLSLRKTDGENRIAVEIENSLPPDPTPPEDHRRGLGTRLIAAFGAQLEAEVNRVQTDRTYLLSVVFDRQAAAASDPSLQARHPAL